MPADKLRFPGDAATGSKDLIENNYVVYQDFTSSEELNYFPEQSFTIILLDHCSGACTTDIDMYDLSSKQLFIHLPDKTFKWNISPESYGRRLLIKRTLMDTFTVPIRHTFSAANKHIALKLDEEGYRKFSDEFAAIKKEIGSNLVFHELINARARLIALIVHLWKEYVHGRTEVSQGADISNRFHALIDQHYKSEKKVAFYADQLCITANYLGVLSRKAFSMSPLDLIRERVILEAKKLLHSSKKSVKEISFELGYDNLSYFSYLFKMKTGMTPKEYRQKLSIY
ncbi:AraC family transcriptional regulator [Niabella pedocola]|uniref:AraC family transcriptional regulator n=1 Tax=Niabella pedocola TaxID=1752077 RepID=A0ABS8PLV5_9BACT|nr:helix-turn-helix domain-containing protein [Niabella pedocola]MCD2422085.1 AraC family transcriptional regulator [Niabella pedocola]